ncbi:MAG: hypothetical protein U0176_06025 [Bacteroidia bacterium]
MKKILLLFSFLMLAFTAVQAQGNGNGNAYGQGSGNNSGNGWAWGNGGGFNALVTYLENGGQVPHVVALAAIYKAREWGQQNFGLNYGQMVAKYAQGQLTVTYVSVAPPMLVFRVRYGGGNIDVILDNV